MEIRESEDRDRHSIRALHREAFGESEGDLVSELAISLLEDRTARPILSLVAEDSGEIIGNIIFSTAHIDGAEDISAYILAPLAVKKNHQRSGIGTQLITHGLEMLRERGATVVLVYGDPHYYKRTGFVAGHGLEPPHALKYPVDAWMAQYLKESTPAEIRGKVRCARSLDPPEYW
jgi:predicted N-acetyltransferase YhbS